MVLVGSLSVILELLVRLVVWDAERGGSSSSEFDSLLHLVASRGLDVLLTAWCALS